MQVQLSWIFARRQRVSQAEGLAVLSRDISYPSWLDKCRLSIDDFLYLKHDI